MHLVKEDGIRIDNRKKKKEREREEGMLIS
jgi:hypothetical protein